MSNIDILFTTNQIVHETDDGVKELDYSMFASSLEKQTIDPMVIDKSDGTKEIIAISTYDKYEYDDRFIGICQKSGDKYPYYPTVINEEIKVVANPRELGQIESENQNYYLIDCKTGLVYLSDIRRKTSLSTWLSSKIQGEVYIKIIVDEEEFLESTKILDSISFAITPDMYSQADEGIRGYLARDAFGYGNDVAWASIKICYKKRRFDENAKSIVKKMFNRKDDYQSIVVQGRDDKNIGGILNLDGIVRKIKIQADLDEHNSFPNPDSVFRQLIHIINNE